MANIKLTNDEFVKDNGDGTFTFGGMTALQQTHRDLDNQLVFVTALQTQATDNVTTVNNLLAANLALRTVGTGLGCVDPGEPA